MKLNYTAKILKPDSETVIMFFLLVLLMISCYIAEVFFNFIGLGIDTGLVKAMLKALVEVPAFLALFLLDILATTFRIINIQIINIQYFFYLLFLLFEVIYLYILAKIPIIILNASATYKKSKRRRVFLALATILVFCILVFIGYAAQKREGCGGVNCARGFSRITVWNPSIRYLPNGTVQFTLINGAGSTVTGLNIAIAGCICVIPPAVGNADECGTLQIGASDRYDVTVTCPTKGVGESFSLPVEITYVENINGIEKLRNESGVLRGLIDRV